MNKNIIHPPPETSILGIPNALLAHYGAKPHHAGVPLLAEKLRQGYRNIALLVLDGLGIAALNAHAPDGFLRQHCAAALSSVNPCTTVSAITTFETGLTPIEHGWLGWSQYFEEIGKCVDLFTGHQSGTGRPAAERNVVSAAIGYRDLFDQIREAAPDVECCRVSPFGAYYSDTCEAICAHIDTLCKKDGRRYIDAYHFQPDQDMHQTGCYSERVKADVVLFDKQIEQLAAGLTGTLLIVTADHGLTDITMPGIDAYPDIAACLSAPPTREPRSLSFFVKEDRKKAFPSLWNAQFGNHFILMTGDEAYHSGHFGYGAPHARSRGFLGDYVALATGDLGLWYRNEDGKLHDFKAAHAGLSAKEMMVPLILIER